VIKLIFLNGRIFKRKYVKRSPIQWAAAFEQHSNALVHGLRVFSVAAAHWIGEKDNNAADFTPHF